MNFDMPLFTARNYLLKNGFDHLRLFSLDLSIDEFTSLSPQSQEAYTFLIACNKDIELAKKFRLKQQRRDQDISSLESYMSQLIKEHDQFFRTDIITSRENLKTVVLEQKNLSVGDIREIFQYHNSACSDDLYGLRLFWCLMRLQKSGKLDQKEVERIYIMSVDWPIGLQIDIDHNSESN